MIGTLQLPDLSALALRLLSHGGTRRIQASDTYQPQSTWITCLTLLNLLHNVINKTIHRIHVTESTYQSRLARRCASQWRPRRRAIPRNEYPK
jgi:hypothetical protein